MQKRLLWTSLLIMAVKTRSAGKAVPAAYLGGQREALGRELRYITRSFMLYEAGIPSVAFVVIVEGTDSSWVTLARVSVCSFTWRGVHGACMPTYMAEYDSMTVLLHGVCLSSGLGPHHVSRRSSYIVYADCNSKIQSSASHQHSLANR
ncbi:hypothetical protein V8C44DRAFT_337968 [Trichoderma aethiopicum]